MELTAPVISRQRVFVAGKDGVLTSLDLKSGDCEYRVFTGGMIHFPPAMRKGKGYLGSGDGWMYCFDQHSGGLLWRFRAAPRERRIPVYGALCSTWPVAGGVLVEDGKAYFAAGIANYDGTHVYALNADSGQVLWENNTSGHLASKKKAV